MLSNRNRKMEHVLRRSGPSLMSLHYEMGVVTRMLEELNTQLSEIDGRASKTNRDIAEILDRSKTAAAQLDALSGQLSETAGEQTFHSLSSGIVTFLAAGLTIGTYIGTSIDPGSAVLIMTAGVVILVAAFVLGLFERLSARKRE